jgi:hypothetical protein
MILRKDLLTGEEFYGRINQNFKSANNRVKYYNEKANKIRHSKRDYDHKLHRNYLITNEILGKNKSATFHREYLLGKGYSFGIFTHLMSYENQNRYAIYNHLIIPEGESKYKIVKI